MYNTSKKLFISEPDGLMLSGIAGIVWTALGAADGLQTSSDYSGWLQTAGLKACPGNSGWCCMASR